MKNILFFISLFSISTAWAQNQVTIEECQNWAVSQSSAGIQRELNEQLLKVKLEDASSHIHPKLEINGELSFQSDVPQLPVDWGVDKLSRDHYGVSLDFEQVIFEGAKFFYARDFERLKNQSEIYNLELSINELKEKVIAIYLNLLIVEKQSKLLVSVENTISDQLNQLNSLLKEGVVYGNSVAQLELEGLKIQQQKGELMATKKTLVSSLSIITGQDLDSAVFLVPELPLIDITTPSQRLEYDIFKNQLACLDFQRKLHFSKSLPKFTFFATGGYGRPAYNFFSNDFDWFYMVGIEFKIPVIAWVKTKGLGDIIELQKKILQSKESDYEKFNTIEIQEKVNEIYKIENRLLLDRKINSKHSEITKTSKIQLQNGAITAYDFIRLQNEELQSLMSYEVHRMQLLKAKFELLGLMGRL